MGTFLVVFVRFLVVALYLVLLGRVAMSWVNPRFQGRLGRFVFESTEPFLGPIRRLLPRTGMIDFSPVVAFLLLSIVVGAFGLR